MAPAKAANALWLLLGSAALWLSLLGVRTACASKAVTARLAAKWPETPLLLEARWVRAGPRGRVGGKRLWAPGDLRPRGPAPPRPGRLRPRNPPLWVVFAFIYKERTGKRRAGWGRVSFRHFSRD